MSLAGVRRPSRRVLWAALALSLAAALLTPAGGAQPRLWLVDAGAPPPAGTVVVGRLALADALIVSSSRPVADAVPADAPLQWSSALATEAVQGAAESVSDAVTSTGATAVWPTTTGTEAVVALVDTGVAPVPALEGAVVGEIDFSGSGGGDGYGHGTFLASLIAGRGADHPGVAPGAGVLSLKVADANGETDLARVLSALDWLAGPGYEGGIRIATLALGVDADSPAGRFMDKAVERLAARGVLVVTAVGNDGPATLSSPATARGSLSVGATDAAGAVASFSGAGLDRARVAQPDVTARGVDVVAHLHDDAVIARRHPGARVADGLYRGNGTSMSTALVAGVAALVQSVRPDLDGPFLAASLGADGAAVDAASALDRSLELAGPPSVTGPGKSAGAGKADPKGPALGHHDRPVPGWVDWDGVDPANPPTPESIRWGSIRWGSIRWGSIRWGSIRWGSIRWGTAWHTHQWTSLRWRDGSWGDASWPGAELGGVEWDGKVWRGLPAEGDPQWSSLRWRADVWAAELDAPAKGAPTSP